MTTITPLQSKMNGVIAHIHHSRTEKCEDCVNYNCPIVGIPDIVCPYMQGVHA